MMETIKEIICWEQYLPIKPACFDEFESEDGDIDSSKLDFINSPVIGSTICRQTHGQTTNLVVLATPLDSKGIGDVYIFLVAKRSGHNH